MKTKRLISLLVFLLVTAEVALVLLSWILSATMTEGVRALLSSEGIRWFFGNYADMLGARPLAWLVLLSMAGGAIWKSGLLRFDRSKDYQHGLVVAMSLLLIYIGVLSLLTLVPHAVLLSATGSLWNSPFSRALVPILAFGIILCSVGHGIAVHAFASLSDVCQAFCFGVGKAAPLFLLYVLSVQFYESLHFVFF